MRYQNPVIRGFAADPSVCRVDGDYYLVTSSFEYFPALPVFHSTDLVNWEQVGNCVGFENAVDLSGAGESGGVWAPTIRYENGTFYVTAAEEHFGNFVVHAKDVRGPWSKPVRVDIGGIDPSLFFEDGKAYYCTNDNAGEGRETVKLGVIDPDTGETLEPFRAIWHGAGGGWTEAPHVYHVGEWYYLLCAEGGTSFGHHEVAARAKCIWGPYEACPHNPILTNRNDTGKEAVCCGHGDLLEDSAGNWWMVFLGQRSGALSLSQLGRETYLMPVVWEEGWPLVPGGKAKSLAEGPVGEDVCQRPWSSFSDDFFVQEWPCWWRFVRNPRLSSYERKDGILTICPSGKKPSAEAMEGFVCTRQPDLDFRMSAALSFSPENEGDAAGLLIWLAHDFYALFGIRRKNGRTELFLQRRLDDLDVTAWAEELRVGREREYGSAPEELRRTGESGMCEKASGTVRPLHMRLMIEGTAEEYRFYVVGADGTRQLKCTASARFFSTAVVRRCFTGTMAGLYAESLQETKSAAKFSEFRMENPAEEKLL